MMDRDSSYRQLEYQKTQLETRLDGLVRKVGPNHRDVQNLRAELETLNAQLQQRRAEVARRAYETLGAPLIHPETQPPVKAPAAAGLSNDRWVGIGGGVLGALVGTLAGLGGALSRRHKRAAQTLFIAAGLVGLVMATLAFHSFCQSGYRGYFSLGLTAGGVVLMMAMLMVLLGRRYRAMELKRVEAMDL
jgi:hypothetical protein